MKEALLVKSDGSYEILPYQKRNVRWSWNRALYNPEGPLNEWEIVRLATGYDEMVPIGNIINLKGMCIWTAVQEFQERIPVNKFATSLQRMNYLPSGGYIRGDVLITGEHTYSNRGGSRDGNPSIRINQYGYRGTGTIKTLGKRKIKLLIQRIELANKLGKSSIPMPEKELELSTLGVLDSKSSFTFRS